ncbi:MAG: hypothetical protein IJQ66_03540 [Clostridia bacterium]|nr:hypothetical protein [Clostridia bacterium]MBQ9354117.1 hypothetical protein [Clostridia bacterium]
MIDIHSHVLPGVDDGSDNEKESLSMLKEAEMQGVTDMIFTPHYRVDYRVKADRLKEVFADFSEKAKADGCNVNLYLGQELYAFRDLGSYLDEGKLLPMNGTKYVLLEFSSSIVCDIVESAYDVSVMGYIPIIAHIERYSYANIYTAEEVKELGGLIQINSVSVTGDAKRDYRKRAQAYLKADLVDFVASDIHSFRKYTMAEAYKIIEKKYGTERAERLFVKNALQIIGK